MENKKTEFQLHEVLAMWKKEDKNGKPYFSSKGIIGFYNTKKEDPKHPDIRIYKVDEQGKLGKEAYLSLWCNVGKNGKKYLSGKLGGKRVVGFINQTGNPKQPYFKVFWADESKQEEVKPVETPKEEKIEYTLPF